MANGQLKRRLRWTLRQVEHLLAMFGLGTLVYLVGFDYTRITSESMKPTLCGTSWENGDRVLTERVSYWFRSPRRWEVIAFRDKEGARIMKRVIGLPGECVQMQRDGRILIDGEEVAPPPDLGFLRYFPYGNLISGHTADCGDGYYLLGDDSRDSDDSRFNGPVPPNRVIGRAWLIVGLSGRRGFVR